MGRFKKIVQFEKVNMPEYQYNYLYHGLLLGLVFVLGGALICVIFIVIGAISDIMLLGLIPVCLWGLVTIALLILFVVHTKKLSKRLTNDKTVEFENYYALIDYETAKNELAKENFIVDGKLIFEKEDDVFAAEDIYSSLQESIDLEDCDIEFFCKTLSGAYYFRLEFYKKIDNEMLSIADIDQNLYTFFVHNMHLIKNQRLFQLFVENKREFLKLLFKYNDSRKMELKLKSEAKKI